MRTPVSSFASVARMSCLLAIAGLACSCASKPSHDTVAAPPPQPARVVATLPADQLPTLADTKVRDYPGLHNVVAYHDGFISGSAPDGDAGYDAIAALGARTIISVDGAPPDAAAARLRGMRYIHLPIGYNGFDEQRKLELARAVRDAEKDGPVYIHCHHGKHRSAGAAGAVAVSLGWLTPDQAVARMKLSGTAPDYTGLYRCTASAVPLGAGLIDSVVPDFRESQQPQGLVKSMVEIDEVFDHLKLIEKAGGSEGGGWNVPADHPDLVPVAEAGRLADLFRLLLDDARVKSKPADFAAALKADSERAQAIEDMLAAPPSQRDTKTLSANLKLLAASCKDCHATHRDAIAP